MSVGKPTSYAFDTNRVFPRLRSEYCPGVSSLFASRPRSALARPGHELKALAEHVAITDKNFAADTTLSKLNSANGYDSQNVLGVTTQRGSGKRINRTVSFRSE